MPQFLPFYYLCHINPQKIMELFRYYYYTDFAFTPTMDRYFYHPDHIGSSSWITDNTGRPIQHLHYLPFGEDWVDQRNSNWNAPYTFSGKEKDVETGYGYVKKLRFFSSLAFGNEKQVFHYAHYLRRFGARYYDSGLSIWLSVDPMSDKYPSMSPYNYCANNPVMLTDPDGRWIPGLDEDGNTTYTAEKGDNLCTFQKQFSVGKKEALGIFNQSKISTADDASFERGQHIIKGDVVKKATGSDVLKGKWGYMTKTQKASQIMFAIRYSQVNESYDDNGSVDLNDFIEGMSYPESSLDNVQIPVNGGEMILINRITIFSPTSTNSDNSLISWASDREGEFQRKDGSTFFSYRYYNNKNPNAHCKMPAISIAVPSKNSDKFEKSYK